MELSVNGYQIDYRMKFINQLKRESFNHRVQGVSSVLSDYVSPSNFDLLKSNADFPEDLIPLTLRAIDDYSSINPSDLLFLINKISQCFNLNIEQYFEKELVYLYFKGLIQLENSELWEVSNYKILILKPNPYYWQLFDNNPQTTEAIGFIGEGGLGSLDNTLKIRMGLNENYCKQGMGTALMQKFITDVTPPRGGFEAKGYMPGSRRIVQKLGFHYNQDLDTFVYKK